MPGYPITNPEDPMQSATEDLAEAGGNALGLALWGAIDAGLVGGAAKLAWGAAKSTAEIGYGAGRAAYKGAAWAAGSATTKGAVKSTAKFGVGALAGGAAAAATSIGGTAIGVGWGVGWGVGKGVVGLGTDIVKQGLRVGSTSGGAAMMLAGAAGAGVLAAAWPSSHTIQRSPHERGASVAGIMQDMQASGDIVIGMHHSR